MCGIAGFIGEGSTEVLERMMVTLRHRGPDAQGLWQNPGIGMAHTRLSIIDLSKGAGQPMLSADGRFVLVFNGEIYNYRELREELVEYPFTTKSDTEVILAAYAAWGTKAFARLDGMFALALYDTRTQELLLARDPLGKKPLYWSRQGNVFAFGSELKALHAHPSIACTLDHRSLAHYLAREYVPTPRTIFQNIHKLMPGTYMRICGTAITEEQFWVPNRGIAPGSQEEAKKELDVLLAGAVGKRMVSDVPLGIFLSGGLDSSTVAYYAAQTSTQRVQTFSIGFNEKSFDESSVARLIAEHLGTEHHEQILSGEDALALVQNIPDVFDEPVADASVLPSLLLSSFSRQSVTVALGGDGADELFLGYQTFRAEQFARLYGQVPVALRSIIADAAGLLPASAGYFSFDFKAKKFTQDFDPDMFVRHLQWLGSFTEMELDTLFLPELRSYSAGVTRELIEQWCEECAEESHWNALAHFYLRTYCLDDALVKVDRTSMHYGLEVRTPFLDPAVVSFALSLPFEMNYHAGRGKHLLRSLMQDRLPSKVLSKSRQGFTAPIAEWLRGPLKGLMTDLLSPAYVKKQNIFNAVEVERLVREHLNGSCDHRKKLWTLLVFQLWNEKWNSALC